MQYKEARLRASVFQSFGVGAIDSLHLAISECAGVDILLTTDDKFIKAAKRTDSKVTVINPVLWLMEVSNDE
jgi:predicted nucleic acid-binding protein